MSAGGDRGARVAAVCEGGKVAGLALHPIAGVLTAFDYCDRCAVAQAQTRIDFGGVQPLLFCAHHWAEQGGAVLGRYPDAVVTDAASAVWGKA